MGVQLIKQTYLNTFFNALIFQTWIKIINLEYLKLICNEKKLQFFFKQFSLVVTQDQVYIHK